MTYKLINNSVFKMNRAQLVATLQIILLLFFITSWIVYLGSRIHTGDWGLLFLILCMPFAIAFTMFPINFLTNNIFNLFYPSKKFLQDSKYYAQEVPHHDIEKGYPPVTIQIPVYTENFQKVIFPMLESAIRARDAYPGLCNIVVCDDGLQIFLENANTRNLAMDRVEYYDAFNIGYIARPIEGRKGRFKKASNLNSHLQYCDHARYCDGTIVGGNINVGVYIILLDADSKIPMDSISRGIDYMQSHPNVAFIQFKTDPLDNYRTNYFSKQIGRFTMNLYRIVFSIVTRGGEPAPLVGHNAMISFEIMKKVAIPENDKLLYWREDRVSEDFDFSIRAQSKGYIGVYATFSIFQEGVSFTYQDELEKLTKFAYGASELLLSKSYITYLLCCNIPWASKINLSAYLFSYYAIASAIIVAPAHIILTCYISNWYRLTLEPIVVLIFSFILFSVLGPLSSMSILYRTGQETRVLDQITHGIFMFIFYTGVPFSIFKGITSHIFNLPLQWGSTRKTIEKRDTVAGILYNFRWQYIIMLAYALFLGLSVWGLCSAWYGSIPVIIMILGHLIDPFILSPSLWSENFV